MAEPAVCPECGEEVWPASLDQSHRECENCGARVLLKDWPDEWFGEKE